MKNLTFVLLLAVLGSSEVQASLTEDQGYTLEQKQQIAWAIDTLVQTGVLKADENRTPEFQAGLLEQLRREGLLKSGGTKLTAICPDSSK